MARLATIKFIRTSRTNLDAQATAGSLIVGEPYLVTDETPRKFCIGITTSTYVEIGPTTATGGSKVTDLTALTGANLATGDLLNLVDVSDTTMHASGTNVKMTVAELIAGLQALAAMPQKAVGTTQITNGTTTPTNVTGVSWAVKSGHNYFVHIIGQYQTVATTTGIRLEFTGPAMTRSSWRSQVRQAANGTDSFYDAGLANTLTGAASGSVVAANTNYPFFIEGAFAPSADGTLQLTMASEVGSSNAIVQAGTVGILFDCGT